MEHADTFSDYVQPFQIEAPGLRGRLVRLGPAVDSVLASHGYPAPVAGILAEALSLGAVLASGLKYDGVFTLQIQGDGPVSLLLTDVTSEGAIRGYARYDTERLEMTGPVPENPVPRFLGAGHMAFTVDQGPDTERYQGITPLEGATLTDCAHTYFQQSEQLDTAITLCAAPLLETTAQTAPETAPEPARQAWRSAALMIQRLPVTGPADPDEQDDDWRRAVVMMSTVTGGELLDPRLNAADILYRLFHEDGVRVYHQRALRHRCRCSRHRVERTLRSFPKPEVESMIENGFLSVTCEFCNAVYAFDHAELDALWPVPPAP